MVTITIKWTSQKFPVEIDGEMTGELLKTLVFSLTGVGKLLAVHLNFRYFRVKWLIE
jgi:hypothetical protein